ncbi:MAG: DUF4838 domain-containing protein [Victivallales bacterium]|nr:DUF4838 domain-containing protein [Victivallales bacterium]
MRFLPTLTLSLLLTQGMLEGKESKLRLTDHGRTDYVIAVGTAPENYEKTAVSELRHFIRQMTGAELAVKPEAQLKGRRAIYVGQTMFARANGIKTDKLDQEEWQIKTIGDNLIITGGRPVGTLYGVYAFLEQAGVYFLTPDATVIPKTPTLAIKNPDQRRKPDFNGRILGQGIISSRSKYAWAPETLERFKLFSLRSRENGGEWKFAMLYTCKMLNMTSQYSRMHNFYSYVNPKKYFATHPEYFSMTPEGVRYAGRYVKGAGILGGQLCLSNRDVLNITLNSLRQYIANDRKNLPPDKWPVMYDISAMDASSFICRCPECKKISEEEGNESGLVLRYINHIAREIAKEYPEIMIRTFAYTSAELAPKQTRPEKNVIIQYCDLYTRSDCFRPLSHPFNAVQLKKIQDWHAIGARLAIWDYWNMGGKFYWPPRMETNVDAIAPDLRILHENGVESYFSQTEITFAYPQTFLELQHFIGYQLLVDVNKDPEQLIDIFINNYYGKAAPEIKSWLNRIRTGINHDPQRQMVMRMKNWQYNTPKFAAESYKLLQKAKNMVASEPVVERRVDELRLALIWNILYFWHSNASAMGKIGVSREQLLRECRELSEVYLKKYQPEKLEVLREEFETKYAAVSDALPVPEQFKKYPAEAVRLFGYPHFHKRPYGIKVKDSESITGWTLRSPIMGKTPDAPINGRFTCENVDTKQKVWLNMPRAMIPQDEKYHWYKIPKSLRLGNCTLFASNGGRLIIDVSSAFINSDGAEHINEWDVWFSAKFTGPAFVKDSKKENAIAVDMVVLVRPDGWSE